MVSEEFMDEIIESEVEQMDENCEKRISGAQEIISSQCDKIEKLEYENERLNKLAEGISAREESIYAEHKLRIEIESENAALKSKLKIAVEALAFYASLADRLSVEYAYEDGTFAYHVVSDDRVDTLAEKVLTEIGGEI